MRRFTAFAAFALAAGAAAAQPVQPPGLPPFTPLPVLKADFLAKVGSDTVRFGRDAYTLNPAAIAVLERQAIWLVTNPMARASIEGHADIRQSREYALALGERRAAAVRNFLLTRGVRPEQLQIVSWGRERPAVAAAHDATFLQNSRVVTVLLRPEPGAFPPPFYPPPPPPRN
jgi:peptidoglycan-associated lipoprotein